MELTTSWMEKGREEGQRRMLRVFAARHLGTLPPALDERLAALAGPVLERLGDVLLDMRTPADLEAWLDAQS